MTPTYIPGKGEALVAHRDLPPNRIVLRVAPFAAVPYGRFLDTLCVGCLQPCDASVPRCSRCGVARHCASCAASFAGRAHAHECHAYERLKRNERGLTLEHDDLRLLLRVLSRRRQSIDDESSRGVRVVTRDDDTQEENRSSPQESHDPFLVAAAKDSDVIVDTFDDLDALMSGAGDDDDDGRLDDVALATIREVAKQCKFLVAAACRSSEETYARLLGKLQLNGFEITAAEAEAEAGASGRENGDEEKASSGKKQRDTARAEEEGKINAAVLREPVGIGVFPSASRFNHSCEPNCAQRFDAFACVVVETTRHVRQGEELTIPYVDVALDLEKRNERLERAFAFRCDCARCARERRA